MRRSFHEQIPHGVSGNGIADQDRPATAVRQEIVEPAVRGDKRISSPEAPAEVHINRIREILNHQKPHDFVVFIQSRGENRQHLERPERIRQLVDSDVIREMVDLAGTAGEGIVIEYKKRCLW